MSAGKMTDFSKEWATWWLPMTFLLSLVFEETFIEETLSGTSDPRSDIWMEIFGPPELLLEEDAEGRGTDSTGVADQIGITAFTDADFSFLEAFTALEEPSAAGYARIALV
ncbi:hypothetical protein COCNU_11G008340 [Cocos nucifera]|uniref:Uncharacterized protein n=1 Tax=Cocos nucifera TaxID=13894 RepID=A0A8K0IP54_COCNU|nr:hypothetical protein COCNU_11G008340 [Cocos nucifera]